MERSEQNDAWHEDFHPLVLHRALAHRPVDQVLLPYRDYNAGFPSLILPIRTHSVI